MPRKIKLKAATVQVEHKTVVGVDVRPAMTPDGHPVVCQNIKMSDGTVVEVLVSEDAAEQLAAGFAKAAVMVRQIKSQLNGKSSEAMSNSVEVPS